MVNCGLNWGLRSGDIVRLEISCTALVRASFFSVTNTPPPRRLFSFISFVPSVWMRPLMSADLRSVAFRSQNVSITGVFSVDHAICDGDRLQRVRAWHGLDIFG